MTNRDIFKIILSEASGVPIEKVEKLIDEIYAAMNPGNKMDQELTPEEAEDLLRNLRSDLPAVRAWLAKGDYLFRLEKDQSTHH